MDGLVRQVAQSLSHAGIYAKSGTVSAGAAVVSAWISATKEPR